MLVSGTKEALARRNCWAAAAAAGESALRETGMVRFHLTLFLRSTTVKPSSSSLGAAVDRRVLVPPPPSPPSSPPRTC
jgi:hypothetical protein